MSDEVKGVELLPPWLAARYRSKRHLEALVKIDRALRGVNMTWASLHRATEDPGDVASDSVELAAVELAAMVAKLDRVQPWEPSSSAPSFVTTLRAMSGRGERVILTPRQASWLEGLLARADQMVERSLPATPRREAHTGNVVQLRPRGQTQ
jgi:hypothetical protein